MWIRKAPNGKYQFGENYKNPLTGKWQRVTTTVSKNTAHTRKQAQIYLESQINKKLQSVVDGKIKHGITFEQAADNWLADYRLTVKDYTYSNAVSRTKRLKREIGKDTLISKLTSNYLTNYLNDLLYKSKLKNGTVKHFKENLNLIMKYAVLHDYIKHNPMLNVQVNYHKSESSEGAKFLEQGELKNVLDYLYSVNSVYGRFCEFLYLTGMRYGEAASITWRDVHTHTKPWSVSITGTLVKVPGKKAVKQSSPKTQSSVRTINLPDRAVEIIKEQHEETPDGFLFRNPQSAYLPEPTIQMWLRLAKEKFNIDKPVTCHIFRHTHISKLAELDVPMYVIQEQVGHSSEKTTQEIYLHVTKKAKQKLDQKLNSL